MYFCVLSLIDMISRCIVKNSHAVGVEQGVAKPPAIDATVVCTLRAR
jgi:hypothetical protein